MRIVAIAVGAAVVAGVAVAVARSRTSPASPLPVPRAGPQPKDFGVPFAKPPAAGSYWPVKGSDRTVSYFAEDGKIVGCGPCAFGAPRTDSIGPRRHAAVDLNDGVGSTIVAVEDGVVLGQIGGYLGLGTVVIQHADLVTVYAEIDPNSLAKSGLKAGDQVRAGQPIGVGVKSHTGSLMLHFETWSKEYAPKFFTRWAGVAGPPPKGLLNPTEYLLALAANGE